jgi:hypothetical protein
LGETVSKSQTKTKRNKTVLGGVVLGLEEMVRNYNYFSLPRFFFETMAWRPPR